MVVCLSTPTAVSGPTRLPSTQVYKLLGWNQDGVELTWSTPRKLSLASNLVNTPGANGRFLPFRVPSNSPVDTQSSRTAPLRLTYASSLRVNRHHKNVSASFTYSYFKLSPVYSLGAVGTGRR